MLNSNFIILGALIGTIGPIFYIINTIKGKVKPNRVSFLLWSIAPFIIFAAQIKQGVGLKTLMTFSAGFSSIAIFVASFINKKAEWKIKKFDLFCGVLSILGLILWLITKVENMAIAFSILAYFLAAIPTIIKAYKYPNTEIAWTWLTTPVGVTLTLLTLSKLTFVNSSFIICNLLINTLVFSLVQFKISEKFGFSYKQS